MKKYSLQVLLVIAVSIVLQSCVKDKLHSTYTYFLPVYKSKAAVWQSIKSSSPQPLQKTGKLFLYGNYIFVNELNKGVHIIDNSNPKSPVNLSFIAIPGNIDIAVKDNTLYADLFSDLVCIDINDPANAVLRKVIPKVFRERDELTYGTNDTSKYVVDWLKRETTDASELQRNKDLGQPLAWYSTAINNSTAPSVVGVGGSMARFTIVNNYLYTVGRESFSAFNISSSFDPVMKNLISPGWNIETIYPLKDKLFIGSQTGMFIYSITDPGNPVRLGSFAHACFNDPVIADDEYAYVTLRATDASSCWGATALQRNELDIVNITNILQPALAKIYDMTEPKGLSKDGDHLFICDGAGGLKVFNVSNVYDIKLTKQVTGINPFDVICNAGIAIVVADEGIYQYDYNDINNIKLISRINIIKS